MLAFLPSVLTVGNLAAGFTALPLAARSLFLEAAFLVALADVVSFGPPQRSPCT